MVGKRVTTLDRREYLRHRSGMNGDPLIESLTSVDDQRRAATEAST
jgi:hypothetical protein